MNRPRRFDLLVFDWDGTVADSIGAITDCLRLACSDLGYRAPSEDDARYIIGLGLVDALGRLLPECDPVHYPKLTERYRVHYLARAHEVVLFPGAAQALARLRERGFLLAVATGKSRRGLDAVLAQTGLQSQFHATRCADESRAKPHPEMLGFLMQDLGTVAHRTVMIGDTVHDLEMAAGAGVASVSVGYGAHAPGQLAGRAEAGPMASFRELAQWLEANA